jgi:hypothetical protein
MTKVGALLESDGSPKRQKGAQPGHQQHKRPLMDPAQADEVKYYQLPDMNCPKCGNELVRDPEQDVQHDFLDIPPLIVKKIVNIIYAYRYPHCGEYHYAKVPEIVLQPAWSVTQLCPFLPCSTVIWLT